MRYRIYWESTGTKEAKGVEEIDVDGEIFRICDDHGRVVFGEEWTNSDHGIEFRTRMPVYKA